MQDGDSSSARFIAIRYALQHVAAPPPEQLDVFLALLKSKTLKTGEYLLRAGEQSNELAFVNSGLLRFFYQTSDGKESNKSFIAENQFAAAYSAYLTSQPARFSIQALEETQLVVASLQSITDLFDQHSCWQKLGRILAEQVFIKKETREAEFLLDDAKTRYENFQTLYPGLEDRLPQYHVASYLGITPVMLSRIRRH